MGHCVTNDWKSQQCVREGSIHGHALLGNKSATPCVQFTSANTYLPALLTMSGLLVALLVLGVSRIPGQPGVGNVMASRHRRPLMHYNRVQIVDVTLMRQRRLLRVRARRSTADSGLIRDDVAVFAEALQIHRRRHVIVDFFHGPETSTNWSKWNSTSLLWHNDYAAFVYVIFVCVLWRLFTQILQETCMYWKTNTTKEELIQSYKSSRILITE